MWKSFHFLCVDQGNGCSETWMQRFTVPSVGRLVGGWDVECRALPEVTPPVLAVVFATAGVVTG